MKDLRTISILLVFGLFCSQAQADWRFRVGIRAHANARYQPPLVDDFKKDGMTPIRPPIEPFPLDQEKVPPAVVIVEGVEWPTVTIHVMPPINGVPQPCKFCDQAKRELTAAKIPFYVAKTNPAWMASYGAYPIITWKAGNTWYYEFGYPGLVPFTARLKESLSPKPKPKKIAVTAPPPKQSPKQSHIGIRTMHPGRKTAIRHLHNDHKIPMDQLAGMDLESLLTLHDRLHGQL